MKDTKKPKEVEIHLIQKHALFGIYWAVPNIDSVYCESMPENRERWIWQAFKHEQYDRDLLIRTFPFSSYLIEKGNTPTRSLDADSLGDLVLDCVKKYEGEDKLYWMAHSFIQKILKEDFYDLGRYIALPPSKVKGCVDHIKKRRILPESVKVLREEPYKY